MDEAFFPFHEIIQRLSAIEGEIYDDKNGVHSYIYQFEISTPVELDVIRDENGQLEIGLIPPMYRVSTSFRPSYHNITFKAEKINLSNAEREHIMES